MEPKLRDWAQMAAGRPTGSGMKRFWQRLMSSRSRKSRVAAVELSREKNLTTFRVEPGRQAGRRVGRQHVRKRAGRQHVRKRAGRQAGRQAGRRR